MRLAWIALFGVVVGAAAGFTGLGGGFLMVPWLLALGYSPQRAVGTSFLAVLVIAGSALFAHDRLANVDWRAGALLGLGGLVGAQVGARLLERAPAAVFYKLFGLVLLVLAVQMFLKK
jgi:hypothetical protein